ncbi:unnamed protein product [Rotaria socialis]|uniref:Palmitoyltransferase n=1 Tax=Rotaria socialis TaxID=392032 RepID=A0A820JTK4_9BILA|nr:unnamed protein product [Rotaria socialis]
MTVIISPYTNIDGTNRSNFVAFISKTTARLDHHCPWINNCVGEFNQKYFMLFLFYVGVMSVYVMAFLIWSLVVFPVKSDALVVNSIILCVESCLFGLFVITILIDQIQSILNDRSLIDTLKLDEHARMAQQILPPAKVLLRKVFGPGPIIFWLLPCDLKSSNDAIELREMHNV